MGGDGAARAALRAHLALARLALRARAGARADRRADPRLRRPVQGVPARGRRRAAHALGARQADLSARALAGLSGRRGGRRARAASRRRLALHVRRARAHQPRSRDELHHGAARAARRRRARGRGARRARARAVRVARAGRLARAGRRARGVRARRRVVRGRRARPLSRAGLQAGRGHDRVRAAARAAARRRRWRIEVNAPGRPACEGGTPIRDTLLPFFRPALGTEEEEAVLGVLRSGWLTTGPQCERFEAAFQKLVDARHAITTSSCTTGLHLILHAAGVGAGDEVIVPAMTFPATANAVLHAGALPVLADVLPGRLTIDPAAARAAIGPRTRAIVAVHLAGWPAEMDALREIAAAHGLALVEDAAHAIGTRYRGRSAGTLGDAASFSFYANKNLTTCEGGMVTTERDDWARRIRVARLHGLDVDASRRDGRGYRHWEAVALGWKYNLNDLQAALGLAQMPKLGAWQTRRVAIDRRYRARLADVPGVEPLRGPDGGETSAHIFPVLLDTARIRIDRDAVLEALLAENVGVGVHYRALPLHRFFRDDLGFRAEDFPVATGASHRTLSLPIFPTLRDDEVDQVVAALDRIVRFYAR
ncbi:MAG: hypothetical protein DCC71_12550 [Proteobacteria bacterium]|nr:MAG: hypothetical protein DCC71_12550 [Pseudomonadota bacterium]